MIIYERYMVLISLFTPYAGYYFQMINTNGIHGFFPSSYINDQFLSSEVCDYLVII